MAGNTTANVTDADAYINANVIVSEDWDGNDSAGKQRLLNVAQRTLVNKYADYTIPDDAIYEYCAVLATAFNDTNKLARQGVASVSITGVASTTFVTGAWKSMEQLIPSESVRLINADSTNASLPRLTSPRAMKWTVM